MKRYASAWVAALLAAGACGQLGAQAGEPQHAPDFRARQMIMALYFGPQANAPFTATAKTIWVKILPDGSTITTWNQRTVARDMDGRIFQERATFVPQGGSAQPKVHSTEYSDPTAHTYYTCSPQAKVCNLNAYDPPQSLPMLPAGLQADGHTYLTRENMGVDTFEGMPVQRSRETFTFYKETIGNTNTILRVVDYWYSPDLGVNVKVVRHDPRDGDQTLWLTNIVPSPADASVFQVPADYRIFDRRARPVPQGDASSGQP